QRIQMLFQHRPSSPKPSADFQISCVTYPIVIEINEPIWAGLLDFIRDRIGDNPYRCITWADIVSIDHSSLGGEPNRLKGVIKTGVPGNIKKLDQIIRHHEPVMRYPISNVSVQGWILVVSIDKKHMGSVSHIIVDRIVGVLDCSYDFAVLLVVDF